MKNEMEMENEKTKQDWKGKSEKSVNFKEKR